MLAPFDATVWLPYAVADAVLTPRKAAPACPGDAFSRHLPGCREFHMVRRVTHRKLNASVGDVLSRSSLSFSISIPMKTTARLPVATPALLQQ